MTHLTGTDVPYKTLPDTHGLLFYRIQFFRCCDADIITIFDHLALTLQNAQNPAETMKTLRVLLLIERYLRSTQMNTKAYKNLSDILKSLESDKNANVAVKTKKINLIIKARFGS